MRHRGPDHTGCWVSPDRSAALGAVRLAVIDPSPICHQPFQRDHGRFTIVFNAAVYNFYEIRAELVSRGDTFVTDGDTEVVLAACIRWGPEALKRFNGMWALAFYDAVERRGFLARDRYGVKPLFYAVNQRRLCFASELGPLESLDDVGSDINTDAAAMLIQLGYIPAPHTILRGVHRLLPAHYLSFDARGASAPQPYYRIASEPYQHNLDGAGYAEVRTELRRLIANAVVRRRVADVPLGAFLSGGVDSSVVVKHLAEASGSPIKTFSIGYADDAGYDETAYARLVADQFATDHHEIKLTRANILDTFPRVLDHLSEPLADSSIVPTSLVSRFARQHVTVALAGDGGDEVFGGYGRYLGHQSMMAYRRLPSLMRRGLIEPAMRLFSHSRVSVLGNKARQFQKLLRAQRPDPIASHLAWSRFLAPSGEVLFRDRAMPAAIDSQILQLSARLTEGMNHDDLLNRILAFDLQMSLPYDMLQKVDLASMMHSLEVRLPLLDPTVVDFAFSLPSHLKVRRGLRKRLLIETYRGLLPDAVLDRPKRGFEVPFAELVRGPLRSLYHDVVTRRAVESFGVFDYDGLQQILREHTSRKSDHADVLFGMLSLCWWIRKRNG